jgi:hypothetical protein
MSRTTGSPHGCTDGTGNRRGTRPTGRPTPTGDWHSATDDSAERLHALWQNTVAHSRALVAEALAEVASPNWPSAPGSMAGRPACAGSWSTWIEEYARHKGHADLLRESVDGQTGE